MKIKTANLIGIPLNWVVDKCEGGDPRNMAGYIMPEFIGRFATDWAQGGPIIEREFMDVEVTPCGSGQGAPFDTWRAWKHNHSADAAVVCGPTPLIAAMRCYVASKLGDEVEIPDELLKELP